MAASVTSYTANALNQYATVGSSTLTYDGNGNLTQDAGPYPSAYTYDADNHLTKVSPPPPLVSPTHTYDGAGQRKTDWLVVYVSDADGREVLEYSVARGQLRRWLAYGLGPSEVLNDLSLTAATRTTLIPDIQGSVIGTLDAASGR